MTFSIVFPAFHPRKGQETFFIEKIWFTTRLTTRVVFPAWHNFSNETFMQGLANRNKVHTIRNGKRHKVGGILSARYWSSKPYYSKQVEFSIITIKKIFDIEIDENGVVTVDNHVFNEDGERELAENDGLSYSDFSEWIIVPVTKKKKPFSGQIICWTDHIDYNQEKYFV